MKYFILITLCLLLSNCYVYRAYEPAEDEEIPTIDKQISKDKMYEIQANGETYKVLAVAWEGDSLVTQLNRKEDKPMKFHKDDITTVHHRVFSRGRSDALTFGVYGAITAAILLLFQ